MKKLDRSLIIDIVLLLIVSIFFSFYHLEKLYGFEFDQERDFNIVKSIVVDHKFTLIGPRVVSSAGFYLGPWYYYLQVPFFMAMNGDPLYGAVFTGFTSVAICLLIYFVLRQKTSSRLIPLLAAISWVSSANRSNWNVAFVPFFFLIFLHFYWKLEKKVAFQGLFWLTLILSISFNFHPQMIFLLPVWLFALLRYLKAKRLSLTQILLLVLAVFGPFIPLAFFDFRHDFVNTNAALNFLSSSSAKNSAISSFRFSYSLRQFSTSLAFIYTGIQHNLILTSFLLVAGLAYCLKRPRYFFLMFITLSSIVVLGFYREPTWPEYYHFLSGFSFFLLVYLFASEVKLTKLLILLVTIFAVWGNFHFILGYLNPGSYYFKKSMILYMLSENQPYQKLNIINDFKYGDGLGFLPIREYYEKKDGQYNPKLKFYVSYVDSPKHNSTKKDFGLYAISLLRE